MTIIVFLVDTSASMCQRAVVNGVPKTYLDIAKGAVETFLKYRQRSQDCMGDRYMLLTFEDPPNNVKAGWKENHATFMNELKNLQSNGLTSMGEALKNAFDLLNLNRMQSGIDTYGQGRCPFYLEPSVIIVLTDGGQYTIRNGVQQEIILPLHTQMPGTKLTKEPFRWDQRLFSLVLRMPANRVEERTDGKVPHDDSMIEKMCEVTGGRSYKVKSHYVLNQCIESLVQKIQPGVVIHFDPLITNNTGDSACELQFQSTKRMIYVPKQHPPQKTYPVGYWPIPELYWPDPKLTTLPPRDAHPRIKIVSPCCDEPQVLRNFPIDKYELEASPLTMQILSKKESNKVWPLIVSTGLQGVEMPFGYLKPNNGSVHFYVLPYNYQMLLPLINDLFHKFNLNPPNEWVYKFANYVKTIPQYYCPFLRRALATTLNVPYQLVQYILPETLDSFLGPAVASYLKQMKNAAKQEQDNLCLRVLKQVKQPKPAYHQLETAKLSTGGGQLKRDLVTHPMLKDTFTKMHQEIANLDSYTIVVPSIIQSAATKNYRNPYDIPRRDLIDEISRMRDNFFKLPTSGINVVTKDSGHCLPISEMGNYQEYLKNRDAPLRELEPTNVRQHMFGNPYKKDKNMVMVDEADLNDLAPMKASGGGGVLGPHPSSSHTKKNLVGEPNTMTRLSRKRKAGPIRKDYVFKRSVMDMSTGSSSSSIAGENEITSDLLSDDEAGSTLGSGAGSDTEDDTEDCLVMALDSAEESSDGMASWDGVASPILQVNVSPQQDPQTDTTRSDTCKSIPVDRETTEQTNTGSERLEELQEKYEEEAVSSVWPEQQNADLEEQQIELTEQREQTEQTAEESKAVEGTVPAGDISTETEETELEQTVQPTAAAEGEETERKESLVVDQQSDEPKTSGCLDPALTIKETTKQPEPQAIIIEPLSISHSDQSSAPEEYTLSPGRVAPQAPTNEQGPASRPSKDDPTDVMNISNILKTCHNGDADRELRSNSYNFSANSIQTPDAGKPSEPSVMVLANGVVSATMMNGCDGGAVQLNWDYNYALYACVEDEQGREQIEEANLKTRSIVFRDIRRPGRDYGQLLKHLELVQGSRMTRKQFVDMCVHEARRFRRHRMVECIQEWWSQRTDQSHVNGMKRLRHQLEDGANYLYGEGLEHEHAITPDNLYLANDASGGPTSVYGSETFRSTTRFHLY